MFQTSFSCFIVGWIFLCCRLICRRGPVRLLKLLFLHKVIHFLYDTIYFCPAYDVWVLFLVEDVLYIYRSLSVPKLTFLCRREHVILIQSGRNRRLQKTLQTSISSPMNETSIDGKRVLTLSTLPKATQGSVISRIHQPFILVFKKYCIYRYNLNGCTSNLSTGKISCKSCLTIIINFIHIKIVLTFNVSTLSMQYNLLEREMKRKFFLRG